MEIPWPKKGALLITDDGRALNACLNWSWDDLFLYATGYRTAAERLFDYISANHRDQDTLVYPLVFLWRHHVELMLKSLIRNSYRLLGQPSKFPGVHGVLKLWQEFRPLLERIEPNGDQEDLEAVEGLIVQLAAIDKNSFVFRYPTTLDDQPSLPQDLTHINMENLHTCMVGLATFFEAVDTMIDHYQDCKTEMERNL